MKHAFTVEAIGDDQRDMSRSMDGMLAQAGVPHEHRRALRIPSNSPWLAEIVAPHPVFRWRREFVKGNWDYSRANSIGSRGVYVTFLLEEGRVYEACFRVSWRGQKRYFFRLRTDGSEERLNEDRIYGLLKERELAQRYAAEAEINV